MPDDFDPYYQWLGIAPAEQPPNHYRLLGIPPLESSADVISNSADRQMAYLRTLQTGRNGRLAERLLNEVSTARSCLLDEAKKAAYDRDLRRKSPASLPKQKSAPASLHSTASKANNQEEADADATTGDIFSDPMPAASFDHDFAPRPDDLFEDLIAQSSPYGYGIPSTVPAATVSDPEPAADQSRATNPWLFLGIASAGLGSVLVAAIALLALGTMGGMSLGPFSNAFSSKPYVTESQSRENLQQIGRALEQYHKVHNAFPPAHSFNEQGRAKLSWRVYLLPYLGEKRLYERFDLSKSWDEEPNKSLINNMPDVYCTLEFTPTSGKTSYLAIRDEGAMFPRPRLLTDIATVNEMNAAGTRSRDITDNPAETVAVVECDADWSVEWTRPDDYFPDPTKLSRGFGGSRNQGFLALMADGDVKKVSNRADNDTLLSLFRIRDGHPIDQDAFVGAN